MWRKWPDLQVERKSLESCHVSGCHGLFGPDLRAKEDVWREKPNRCLVTMSKDKEGTTTFSVEKLKSFVEQIF